MRCFFCEEQAIGLCRYCLRAVCHFHKEVGPATIQNSTNEIETLEKEGYLTYSLWCGTCVTESTISQIKEDIRAQTREEESFNDQIMSNSSINFENVCEKCNTINVDEDSFCVNCGEELLSQLAQCSKCGYKDKTLLKKVFCPKCESPLPI